MTRTTAARFLTGAALAALVVATVGAGPVTSPASRPADAGAVRRATVIRFLEGRTRRDPEDITALNQLSGEYLSRFRDTGDDGDIALAAAAAAKSLASVPAGVNSGGLAARARAAFALHGFAAARDDARELVEQEPGKKYPLQILGDALLELGDYDEAATVYAKLPKTGEESGDDDADPGDEARLARLAYLRGDTESARQHLAAAVEAARALPTPQPRVLAWVLVQSGQLAFSTGDWDAAERDYQAALAANPDDWPAVDHLADLRAAGKQYDEAISLYARLVDRVPRPELFQSLGDVCAAAGKADEARLWHGRALQGYLKAAEAGNAHYYHHLAGYYSDVAADPAAALRWARKDLEVRHSVYAYDALAWALYQGGQTAPAAEAMDKALALGTRDAHLLYHASLVYFRAGDAVKAKDCLRRTAEANPKFAAFHVHR